MKRRSTLSIIASALALGLAPDPVIEPAAWAAENLVVADGPQAGHRWSPDLTPYAVEILNQLAAESPQNRVSVRKSAQTGLTEVGIAWVGSIIDKTPAKAMVVFPTITSVQDFNREKLTPTIEATEPLRRKVRQHRSRSSASSTALNKRFPGGSLTLTGANSASDLRSKTVKFLFCDEVDEWPQDLDGQGDPMEMAKARQTAFHATGDYKLFEASTPTIQGVSRIDDAFDEGDQRYWHVPCPHCGEYQRLVFGNRETAHGLKFSTEWPYKAHYCCEHCGSLIEHFEKHAMVRAGKWVANNPEPGRHPSYHIDALVSLLTTWDKVAEAFLKAKDDPGRLKAFVNLWLGEAWEERGDAPDWARLFARRDTYPLGTIPFGGLIISGGMDVQANGIFFEIVAWGPGKESWSIDAGFLEGDTADPNAGAWLKADELVVRRYRDAHGQGLAIDLIGVDSGFQTGAVYQWSRRHAHVFAIKGQPGWYHPPVGTPTKQDVTFGGKKIRNGVLLWPVGTWPLKSEFYGHLRKEGKRDGAEFDPPGFCHFSEFHDEGFFKQITDEFLKDVTRKGRVFKEWHGTGNNHFHDCRIYAFAMAEHLGLSRFGMDEWAEIARKRGSHINPERGDLVDRMMVAAPGGDGESRSKLDPAPEELPVADAPAEDDFLGDTENWLG